MNSIEYTRYCDLYSLAEEKIKQVEQIAGDVVMPAVTELRYAGFHCVHSLCSDDSQKNQEELKLAEKHCTRAIYEALEIGVSYYLNQIDNFVKDYWPARIGKVIPDYVEDRLALRRIQNFVARHTRGGAEEEWDTLQEHFEMAQKIYDKLEAARPELSAELYKWRVGILIAILAILVTLIALLVK